jgi:hypothetical protein
MRPSGSVSSEPDPASSANGTNQIEASHSTTPVSIHIELECITVASDAPAEVSSQKIPKKRGRRKETTPRREL